MEGTTHRESLCLNSEDVMLQVILFGDACLLLEELECIGVQPVEVGIQWSATGESHTLCRGLYRPFKYGWGIGPRQLKRWNLLTVPSLEDK